LAGGIIGELIRLEEGLNKLTQVATYTPLILEARTHRQTFRSTPAAVTACLVLGSIRSIKLRRFQSFCDRDGGHRC
jgi:uncharacterized membrane protein YqgA involved in biofilm formation